MSFEIEYTCDGLDCYRTSESYVPEEPVTPCGWHEHDGFHYCPECWKQVKEEISQEEEE